MNNYEVIKRTFEALKHPKQSSERMRLNDNIITSEYMPSYDWAVVGAFHSSGYKTKKEAENKVKRFNKINSKQKN